MARWFEPVEVLGRTDPVDSAAVTGEPTYSPTGTFGALVRSLTAQERSASDYDVTDSVLVLGAMRSPTTLAIEAGVHRLRKDGVTYEVDQVLESADPGKPRRLEFFARRLGGV